MFPYPMRFAPNDYFFEHGYGTARCQDSPGLLASLIYFLPLKKQSWRVCGWTLLVNLDRVRANETSWKSEVLYDVIALISRIACLEPCLINLINEQML